MDFNAVLLFDYTIVFLATFWCSNLIYLRFKNSKATYLSLVFIIISSIATSLLCSFLKIQNSSLNGFVFVMLEMLSLFLLDRRNYYNNIPIMVVSIGLSFSIEIVSIFSVGTILYLFNYLSTNIVSDICVSLFQVLLTLLFIRIKRFKNGLLFFYNKDNFGIGLLLVGPVILLPSLHTGYMSNYLRAIIVVLLCISSIGLFLWLRSAITRHYRKKLKLRAEEYSKLELAEKAKEIEKLSNENASLSSIIHLDNYLINELETTLKNKSDDAINNLLSLSKQRTEFVNNKIINDKLLPTTGNSEIDTVITDIYIKAASHRIDFNLNVDCDINYLIHNIIEQPDFEELIRSCITNSIVDIENNPDTIGKILITITKPNDIYEFTIMDNGIVKDNKNKSISQIIDKSNASIKTNKFDNNDSFTKSITIRFDGLKNNTAL